MNQTRNSRQRRFNRPARQRGVATILIVLMVGLAVSVTVAAALYALRGNQQRQLASHSATSAQAAAWRGAEFMRTLVQDIVNKEEIATGKFLYNLSFGLSGSGTCIPAKPGEGCEMPSIPAWDSETQWVASTDWVEVSADIGDVVPAGNPGFTAAITQVRRMPAFHTYQVKARITGEAGSEAVTNPEGKSEIRPMATSVLEVVYDVRPPVGTTASWSCPAVKSAMVFNGDLIYTGGGIGVENPEGKLEDIVVNGRLSITGGSTARVSGCIKGDVDIAGGSISRYANINSEGKITVSGSIPSGSEFWGSDVTFDNVSGTDVSHLRAGAYLANVIDTVNGVVVGSTRVGGTIISGNVGFPWVGGLLRPENKGSSILVELNDGSKFLLDLEKTVVDGGGVVTAPDMAQERLSGSGVLPGRMSFVATSLHGGQVAQNAYDLTIAHLWAQEIKALARGHYNDLRAGGNITTKGAMIGELSGGGDFTLEGSEPFSIASGTIAGSYKGVGRPATLQERVVGHTPGLPGVPWCDARVKMFDIDVFEPDANYIFRNDAKGKRLIIRNVKRADGTSVDGEYPLEDTAQNAPKFAVLKELMECGNTNDKGCLKIAQAGGGWILGGVVKMPVGVLWFDSSLQVDGVTFQLLNTVVARGAVTLTGSGNHGLRAPNFATAQQVCGGAFYPSNICKSRSQFATWKDEKGKEYTGIPLASSSIITEKSLTASGWELFGNVLLGTTLGGGNGGASLVVNGTLTVGSNVGKADTSVNAGGMKVVVQSADSGHNVSPICSGSTAVIGRPTSILWSRYL